MSQPRQPDERECLYACAGEAAVHLGRRVRHRAVGQSHVAVEYMCDEAQERHIAHGCGIEEVGA